MQKSRAKISSFIITSFFLFCAGVLHVSAANTSISGTTIQNLLIGINDSEVLITNSYCLFQSENSLGCSDTIDFETGNPQYQNLVSSWFAENNEALPISLFVINTLGYSDCNNNTLESCQNSTYLLSSATYTPNNNQPATTSSTTINIDNRGLTAGFFTILWVLVFGVTVSGISKFT